MSSWLVVSSLHRLWTIAPDDEEPVELTTQELENLTEDSDETPAYRAPPHVRSLRESPPR